MPEQILAGKYVVQNEIARGGMGVIYKALDRTLNRVVAIKMVHAHLSGDSSFVERFLREARAMARLQHDNIVTIYAVEEDQGTQLLVMEYFQGRNLRELTKNRPRLPLRDIVSITEQLANALAFAHAHGIIHRDIKPANVMVDARGKAKLTDFGIAAALDEASITSTGQVIGTPEYMSPEQACGTKLDGRSDLYSVGILLHEMLTGNTPYAEASKTSILGKLAFDKEELTLAFPSDVPSLLQGVVRDLLRRQPDERIPDADTLATQLHEILYTLPASPTVPTSSESDETVLVSPPAAANARDKGEPDLPTVLASDGRTEARGTGAMATESTRVPPPTATPRSPAPSHWDETTVLPQQPHKSDSSMKPSPSAAPTPAPSAPSQSSLLFPILGGGLAAVLALTGLVYYFANSSSPAPDTTNPPQQKSQIEPKASEHIEDNRKADEERAQREAELQKERERLAEDQRRLEEKQRQAEAQQAKEAADRKQLEARREASTRERELATKRAREEERKKQTAERRVIEPLHTDESPPQQKEPQVASVFPDQRLQSILERFRQAYENRDLATIQSMSRMSDERLRNVQVMFANYETIRASIKDVTPTEQGASATLFLESVTTAEGERVTLSPLARKSILKISRQGTEWEKISW
jgi:serine/threonine-protein kinase